MPPKLNNCGSRYAPTWRESPGRGHGLPMRKRPFNTFGTLPPFYRVCRTVFFTLSRRFFPRFTGEPVKVLKVGLYISACRVVCGEVDWYKANFRL